MTTTITTDDAPDSEDPRWSRRSTWTPEDQASSSFNGSSARASAVSIDSTCAIAERITTRSAMTWAYETTTVHRSVVTHRFLAVDGPTETVDTGTTLALGLLVRTAAPGEPGPVARLYAHHLERNLGLLSARHFPAHVLPDQNPGNRGDDGIASLMHPLPTSYETLQACARESRRLQRRMLGSPEIDAIRQGPLAHLRRTVWLPILTRYLNCEAPTGWGLLNACLRFFWASPSGTRGAHHFERNERCTDGLLQWAQTDVK
jgi:hypothetical protein